MRFVSILCLILVALACFAPYAAACDHQRSAMLVPQSDARVFANALPPDNCLAMMRPAPAPTVRYFAEVQQPPTVVEVAPPPVMEQQAVTAIPTMMVACQRAARMGFFARRAASRESRRESRHAAREVKAQVRASRRGAAACAMVPAAALVPVCPG